MVTTTSLWFYRGPPDGYAGVIRSCTGDVFTHVCTCVQGCIFNISRKVPSGWYTPESLRQPDLVLDILHKPYDEAVLDTVLPLGRKYRTLYTGLWWMTFTLLPTPYTCVQSAKDVLAVAGVRGLRARTCDELLREVTHAEEVSCRPGTCGPTGFRLQQDSVYPA